MCRCCMALHRPFYKPLSASIYIAMGGLLHASNDSELNVADSFVMKSMIDVALKT